MADPYPRKLVVYDGAPERAPLRPLYNSRVLLSNDQSALSMNAAVEVDVAKMICYNLFFFEIKRYVKCISDRRNSGKFR